MEDIYQTIKQTSEGFFKDRGSKFFAYAFPVGSEEDITIRQKELRKKHYDARHHVYAFRLGADKKRYRASDDGEPSNSSGPPVLGQIRSYDLTDILVVVVRYFGGTKLGVPGLINAYKTAAQDAIEQAEIITKTVDDSIEIKFAYPQMNDVMRILKEESIKPAEQQFEMDCKITIHVRKSLSGRILDRFSKLHQISAEII